MSDQDPTLPPSARANSGPRIDANNLTVQQLDEALQIMHDTGIDFNAAVAKLSSAKVPAAYARAFEQRMTSGDLDTALRFQRRGDLSWSEAVNKVASLQEPRQATQYAAGPPAGWGNAPWYPVQESQWTTQIPVGPGRIAVTTIQLVAMGAELAGTLGVEMDVAMHVLDVARQNGSTVWDALTTVDMGLVARLDPDAVALWRDSAVAIERTSGGGPLSARQGL